MGETLFSSSTNTTTTLTSSLQNMVGALVSRRWPALQGQRLCLSFTIPAPRTVPGTQQVFIAHQVFGDCSEDNTNKIKVEKVVGTAGEE